MKSYQEFIAEEEKSSKATAGYQNDPKGNEKGVEIGAVLWIYLAPFDKDTLQ